MVFDELKKDNVSGAAEILRKAAEIWQRRLLSQSHPFAAIDLVRDDAVAIIQQQPRMAPLFHLASAVLSAFTQDASQASISTLTTAIAAYLAKVQSTKDQLVFKALPLLQTQKHIMTYSKSSLVLELVSSLARQKNDLHVLLCESRPMNEGQSVVKFLASHGLQTKLFVDAAMSLAIAEADVVLVGADRISETIIINKVGTKALALLAQEAGKDIWCVTTLDKFLPDTIVLPGEEPHNAAEVWPEAPAACSISNYYFEEIPIELFSGILCEQGLITPGQLLNQDPSLDPWLVEKFSHLPH